MLCYAMLYYNKEPCSLPSSAADSLPLAAPASFCLLPITFRASRQAALLLLS